MLEWVKVADESEFDLTDRKYVEVDDDIQIGLFKLEENEKYYAIEAWCSHQKVSLVTGYVDGFEITCPLHAARFDLRDGKHKCLPAVKPVESFAVKVAGGEIFIQI
jgi:3-phenylpropionate/trans-cinnamate dioxygenase ferredoxin subunit